MQKNPLSYQKIATGLLSELPDRTQDILAKRFGLTVEEPETLEAIGQEHGITRERVRQIVEDGLRILRERAALDTRKNPGAVDALNQCAQCLRQLGSLKREDLLVQSMGVEEEAPHVVFLLHLGSNFYRQRETEEFYPFWAVKPELLKEAPEIHQKVVQHFEDSNALLSDKEVKERLLDQSEYKHLHPKTFFSFLEASKQVMRSFDGRWGLRVWPEVNPKGVREKAYIVLKQNSKPLHFLEITDLIQELQKALPYNPERKILSQTVHNELIKDPRFVLVGRGVYALSDWGYSPGTVKDILVSILKEAGDPLSREEITEKILSQRQVKESTILLNLQNRMLFTRDSEGNYYLKA